MSSINTEYPVSNVPNAAALGENPRSIDIDYLIVRISSTLPGGGGGTVTESSTSTLTNKSLSDTTTKIINSVTATKQIGFNLSAMNANTTVTLTSNAQTSYSLNIPNLGANSDIVTTTGNQTINGIKTFQSINIGAVKNEATATATTSNATPTVLYTLPTTSNFVYGVTAELVCSGPTAVSFLRISALAKNIAGTLSLITTHDNFVIGEPALNGVAVTITVVGINILVNVTGLALTTIKWGGTVRYLQNTT